MATTNDPDVEVNQIDQERINEFGRSNNRLMEIRADIKQYKIDGEKLDDAISDLMMSMGGNVKLFVGESFIEVSEEFATEYCNKKQEEVQKKIADLTAEEETILTRQATLKKDLYGKFGTSIQLEY